MNDLQLLRYSRHILLPEIGIEGQQLLQAARVLVVGLGGLGSPSCIYLAAAGVGELVLADGDVVDLTNLQRQIVHHQSTLNIPKAESARQNLLEINPEVNVVPLCERLEEQRLIAEVKLADVVLDCSDNFTTRYAINRACFQTGTALVSGAAIKFDGQVSVFDFSRNKSPCYNCLFPESDSSEEVRCAVMGVFASLTGIIGCLQAHEALKLILKIGKSLHSRLLLLAGLSMNWREVFITADPGCMVCGQHDGMNNAST